MKAYRLILASFVAIVADIISAVEFDHDGLHLATGDRGGRVVLFERVNPNAVGTQRSAVDVALMLRFSSHRSGQWAWISGNRPPFLGGLRSNIDT